MSAISAAGGRLDHEEHEVRLVDGDLDLRADGRLEDVVGVCGVAAGVHDGELPAAPFAAAVMAVAGHTGGVVNDGLPHADQAVEEGGFADIGPADDGY